MLYPLFRLLARLVLRLFFRRIEVAGLAGVPTHGPVLFVPNHTNALVDPLLLVVTLRRRVTLTAKNLLSRNPLLGALMAGLGVVTFHRRDDIGKGAEPRKNVRSLERCSDILRHGGALCIFPEGVSHSDPHMRPFRTGAARIGLDFLKEVAPGTLQIVPVGLLYTEKDRFRSAVWLRFGAPMDLAQWAAVHPDANAHSLTEELRRRVAELTLQYETRRESLILTWGAEIVQTGGTAPAPLGWKESSVSDWFALLTRLQSGYRTLQTTHVAEIDELTTRVRKYRVELRRLGISPAEVYLPLHHGKALFFIFRELELLLMGLPIALFGLVNHLLPYLIVKRTARALSKDKDHWATNVVYPSFLVFPVFHMLQLTAAWLLLPPLWAGTYTLALPFSGYVAILYFERAQATLRRLRTFCYFLFNPKRQEELAKHGREIIAAIRVLETKVVP
jgi:glycerol-3-phosphate O-acyltransferase / dihydroxyacetone phosphate acyltransferase